MRGGYAVRSANISISTANSLLDFCDKRHLQGGSKNRNPMSGRNCPEGNICAFCRPQKIMGDERAYLLIKVFACTGMTVQELVCLSVEAVQKKKGGHCAGRHSSAFAYPGMFTGRIAGICTEKWNPIRPNFPCKNRACDQEEQRCPHPEKDMPSCPGGGGKGNFHLPAGICTRLP